MAEILLQPFRTKIEQLQAKFMDHALLLSDWYEILFQSPFKEKKPLFRGVNGVWKCLENLSRYEKEKSIFPAKTSGLKLVILKSYMSF